MGIECNCIHRLPTWFGLTYGWSWNYRVLNILINEEMVIQHIKYTREHEREVASSVLP